VKRSTELIQYPFNSTALSSSSDTAMLTCGLFAIPHINSEPQVAVSSTPDPGEAALHSQVGRVMFSRNNTYYTRTYYNECSCTLLTAVGRFTLSVLIHILQQPWILRSSYIYIQMFYLERNDMRTMYKELRLRLIKKKYKNQI
jgi:hypothetical protein